MIIPPINELRALIYMPAGRDAILTENLLRKQSIECCICNKFAKLVEELHDGAGIVLLSSETLTPEALDSISTFLQNQAAWSDLSIIVFTGVATSSSRRTENKLLGGLWNATLLERPIRAASLVNTVEIVLRARKRQYLMRDHLQERTVLEQRLETEYQKQFRIAETFQRAMINLTPMRSFQGIDVQPRYLAAKDEADVGGDFFDVFTLNDTTIAIVVGDVSGKGLEAASLSLEVKYPLRVFLRQTLSPSKTLRSLNSYLLANQDLDEHRQSGFVCVSICTIDTSKQILTWSNAGLEGPFIIKSDLQLEDLSKRSPPIGVMDGDFFHDHVRHFPADETLLIFTDGIIEARHGSNFFGLTGVAAALNRVDTNNISSAIDAIVSDATDFSDGILADDVCIVAARLDEKLDVHSAL